MSAHILELIDDTSLTNLSRKNDVEKYENERNRKDEE